MNFKLQTLFTQAHQAAPLLQLPDLTPEEYNQEYFSLIAPHYGPHLPYWLELSAKVRKEQKCTLDIAYGENPDEKLDVFFAQNATSRSPAVIFFHGGNWRTFSKQEHSFVANLLPKNGVTVIIPDYSLCPKVTLDVIVRQAILSVLWVHQNAGSLGIDAHRLFLAGHSAGGHLAALLTCVAWNKLNADLSIKGSLAISGLHDLNPILHTPVLQEVVHFTSDIVNNFSPVRLVPTGSTPVIAAVGAQETREYQRQTGLLETAWSSQRVKKLVVPDKHHCSMVECLAQEDNPLFSDFLALIQG